MTRKLFLCLIACAAMAMAKPNFSGDWKLNVSKSEFGPMPAPEKLTMKIDHKEPELVIKQAQTGAMGEMEAELKYNTEGKETTNTMGPMEAKSTATWDGDVLVISTKLNLGGNDLTLKSRWTLGADGKTLTNATHLTSPQGEVDLTYVLEKQ